MGLLGWKSESNLNVIFSVFSPIKKGFRNNGSFGSYKKEGIATFATRYSYFNDAVRWFNQRAIFIPGVE